MATKSTTVRLTLKITSFIVKVLLNAIFYILVVIAVINLSKEAYKFTYQLYGPDPVEPTPGREIIIQINKGESTMDIASKLELNRAIKNKYSFYLKARLENKSIMPGTYQINNSMTYGEILAIITDYSASLVKEEAEATEEDTKANENTEAETSTKEEKDKEKDTKKDTKKDKD